MPSSAEHVLGHAAEYLRGELDEREALATYEHLLTCAGCAAGLQLAAGLRRAGGRAVEAPLPPADELGRRRELAFLRGVRQRPGQGSPRRARLAGWAPALAAAAVLLLLLRPWGATELTSLAPYADHDPLPVRVSRAVAPPASFEAARLAGLAAYARGDWEEAATRLAEAVERRPDHAESWLYRGSALRQAGAAQAAHHALREAAALSPATEVAGAEARWQLAQLELAAGDREGAGRWLEELDGAPRRAGEAAELRARLRR